MKKRIIFVYLFALLTAVALFSTQALGEGQIVAEGTCGEHLTWNLSSNGTLTVSGTGEMTPNYSLSGGPWSPYANQIRKVIIGNGVTTVSKNTFRGCTQLASVVFPESLTAIGEYAFQGCYALTEVTIPNGVTRVEANAFHSCNQITRLTLPGTLTYLGSHAFSDCNRLTDIYVPDLNAWLNITAAGLENNFRIANQGSKDKNLYINGQRLTEIILPAGTTQIPASAFYGFHITSVTIPDSVTAIGSNAFMNCGFLREITIPGSVKEIGAGAFSKCVLLSDVTLSAGVTTIQNGVFSECSSL